MSNFTIQVFKNGEWVVDAMHSQLAFALFRYAQADCARILDKIGRVYVREAGIWEWTIPSRHVQNTASRMVFEDYERYLRHKNQKVTDIQPVFVPIHNIVYAPEFEIWELVNV